MIRNSETGYAVDGESGVYHLRYAEHASQFFKTRSKRGVEAFGAVKPCKDCFPPARKGRRCAS